MLIRRETLVAGSARDPLARRLEAVAGIRRGDEAHAQALMRRYVEPRVVPTPQHQNGQDAA